MSVRIRHAIPRDFPLDLLVRTPSEVAKRLRWGDGFVQEILAKGKVMYERRRKVGTAKYAKYAKTEWVWGNARLTNWMNTLSCSTPSLFASFASFAV